jgi:hypothetical protein
MDGYRNLKKGMGGGGMGGMLSALTSEHQSLQSVAENIGADAINLLLHSKMRSFPPLCCLLLLFSIPLPCLCLCAVDAEGVDPK